MRQDEALRQLRLAAESRAVRGSLLFHLDLATEIGRTACRDCGFATQETATIVDAEGYALMALDGSPANALVAIVRFAPDGRPIVTPAKGAPPRAVGAMARAGRALALEFPAPDHQIMVIPPSDRAGLDDPLEAYAMKRSIHSGDVVIGQHWHARLSSDGACVLDKVPLCQTDMILESRPEMPPMAVDITHFGAVPTEMHHYISLRHGMALTVVTLESQLLWHVDGERVALIGSSV